MSGKVAALGLFMLAFGGASCARHAASPKTALSVESRACLDVLSKKAGALGLEWPWKPCRGGDGPACVEALRDVLNAQPERGAVACAQRSAKELCEAGQMGGCTLVVKL